MINVERIISRNIWRGFNLLKGYMDLNVAKRLFVELLFVKLLNDELKKENKYFTDKIKGRVDLDKYEENIEALLIELRNFISLNKVLNGLILEIFTLEKDDDYKILSELLNLLNSIVIDTESKPSIIYKYFLDMLFKNSRGDITTSPDINELISVLLEEKEILSLYDPTIGSGILALDVALKHNNVEIYGQEINRDMVSICKMLLILDERISDIDNIVEGNTIVNPGNIESNTLKKFDCIVCSPPIGLKDWGYNEIASGDKFNRFHRGLPPKSLADYAFISHAIESLNDTGIAVMVEGSGVLFRESAEGIIRRELIEENIIDTIILLPSNMMYGTTIPVNIIIFNKSKKNEDILFIDASKEVEGNKILTTISDETINKIINIYKKRLETEGLSRRVSKEEIEDASYNLNVQRYIETKIRKDELDIDELGKNIESLISKLQDIQSTIDKSIY